MQYWVFYLGGVGGDGFVNLLEHANNITPVDSHLTWRVREEGVLNNKVAFGTAKSLSHYFLKGPDPSLDLSTVEPTEFYRNLVDNDINTVISAHAVEYDYNSKFKYWDLLEKNQHKIALYSLDTQRIIDDFCDKNPILGFRRAEFEEKFSRTTPPLYWMRDLNYRTYINIDLAWESWDYLNNILVSIGIDLDRKYYEEYLDLARRRKC